MCSCNFCSLNFPDRKSLRRHLATAHIGAKNKTGNRYFLGYLSAPAIAIYCQHCGNYFSSRDELLRHLTLASGMTNNQDTQRVAYKEAKQNTGNEQGIYGGEMNRSTITDITNSSEGINPSATIPRFHRRFVRKHGVAIGGSPKMARGTNHNGVGKLIGTSENSSIHNGKENIPTGPKSMRIGRISRNISSSHSHGRNASLGLNHNVNAVIGSLSSHHESIGFNGAMDTRTHGTSTRGRRRSGSYNFHTGKSRRASSSSGGSMKDVPWMDNWRHEHTSFGKFLNDPSGRSFRKNSANTVASSNTTGDDTMEVKAPTASHERIDQKHNIPDIYEFGTGPNSAQDPLMDLSVLLPCDTANHLSGVPAISTCSDPSSVNIELLASSNDSIINWYTNTNSGSDLDSNQQLLTPNCTPPPSPPGYSVEGIGTRRNGTFMTVDLDKLVEFKPYGNGRERNHRFGSSTLELSPPYNQYLWLSKNRKYLVRGKHAINHIDPSNEVCQRLESLVVSKAVLEAKGYEVVAAKELDKHRRCRNCHVKKYKWMRNRSGEHVPCHGHAGQLQQYGVDGKGLEILRWNCCGVDRNAENWCVQWGHHDLEPELPDGTPTVIPPNNNEVFAIALDCEMGIATDGSSVILQLSIVDFFSGEVLVDNLIRPSKPVASWQEKFSGINERRMEEEGRAGRAFTDLEAARAAMFRFVGNNTIIVGHSAQCDLDALAISHDRVIDTHIVIPRRLGMRHGLKDLCAEYAKMDVQAISHDCLEDAFAVRAVVIAVLGDPVMVEGMGRRVEELERVGGMENDERARMARVERVRAERAEVWYKTQVPQRPEWLSYCQQFVPEHAGYHSYGY